MDPESQFTPEEIARLRAILHYDDEFKEMMVLRGAKAVVFKTYRTAVIGTAGLITSVVFMWDFIKSALRGLLQ